MTFGEFRHTEQYRLADEICFVDTNGVEMDIDNLHEETLQNIEVVAANSDGGYLEIMLD